MASVNKVILVGRLGKDPDVKFMSDGRAVANFTVATDETYKDKSGEKQKKVEWHNITVWGNSVEAFVQKYLHKGDMVYIEGKLQTRSWEDKQTGATKYMTEVNVTDIKGLVTAPVELGNTQPPRQNSTTTRAYAPRPAQRQAAPAAVVDDDIPF